MLPLDIFYLIGLRLDINDILNYSLMSKKVHEITFNNINFWLFKCEKDLNISLFPCSLTKIKHYYWFNNKYDKMLDSVRKN